MERIRLSRLAPYERKELEAVLRAPQGERFLSDYGDSAAWWILLLLAALGGAIASGMQVWEGFSLFGVWSFRFALAFLACLAVLGWVAVHWIGNHNRRGFAVTSFATLRVKGPRLALVRHVDVSRIEWTKHTPPRRQQRFSVLQLTGANGKTLTLYVHAGWVRAAIAQIDQARAAAKLPPIEGDARKLPE